MIALRVQLSQGAVDPADLRFLLVRPAITGGRPNPCPTWLQAAAWAQLRALSEHGGVFAGIDESFVNLEQ